MNISPHAFTMVNTVNTEFSYVEVCFMDQASKALEIEDNVNLALIIGYTFKKWDTRQKQDLEKGYVKGYGFLSFAKKFGDKYGKKLIDTAIKTGIDAAKNAFKRVVQKTAEATGDLIGNKTADKITSAGKAKEKEKENTNKPE